MIKLETIPSSQAWQPNADTVYSFAGGHRTCRVHGAARLVRLLSHAGQAPEGQFYGANRDDGEFWFAEADFLRIKAAAEADLRQQGGWDPARARDRISMYLRHQLRDLLAVRRDWTPSFDYYALLNVPGGESLVALVGKVRKQPVYSPDFPGEELARKAGLELPGGLTQYVINFTFPANQAMRPRIRSPISF